jgi:cellobiose phosphorylase
MRFGHFSSDGTEYVVTTTATPRPWYNRFGNADHSIVISHTAGGYAIAGDAHRFQLNWYVPRYDESGRYLYLRDDDSGRYWGGSYAPVRRRLDRYECRHGHGWSTFVSGQDGIGCEYTVFVPLDGPVEMWHVTLTNLSRRPRRVTAIPFVEWTIDDVPQSLDDLPYMAHSDAGYDATTHSVWASKRQTTEYRFFRAFLAADFRPDGWETNRTAFVGRDRSLANPRAVERGELDGEPCEAELAIGALAKRFRLKPGGVASFNVISGLARTRGERAALRRRFLAPGRPERELARLKRFWGRMPERFSIRTPDRALDRYVNRCLVPHVYKQGSSNAIRPIRIQFRNQMQDALGMAILAPGHARRLIFRLMKFHCSSGDALNWMSYGADWPQKPEHVDTKLWIVYSTAAYIRNTGDFAILKHRERFYDDPRPTSLLDLINLAIEKSWRDRGMHGLSLCGRGDWNDSLDGMGRRGRGVSVWMSEALHLALVEGAELASRTGDRRRARLLAARARQMRAAINRHGWDGRWYLMGYTDDGRPVGSHRSREGRIFLMTQIWAVISGVATPERRRKLFRSVDRLLQTDYGARLNDRPFTRPDPSIGSVTFLQQGLRPFQRVPRVRKRPGRTRRRPLRGAAEAVPLLPRSGHHPVRAVRAANLLQAASAPPEIRRDFPGLGDHRAELVSEGRRRGTLRRPRRVRRLGDQPQHPPQVEARFHPPPHPGRDLRD